MDDGMEAHFAALREFIHERFRVVDTKLDRVIADVSDLKQRMTAVEIQVGQLVTAGGRLNERLDRLDVRLDWIERRLDLVDPV